jgi:hypothetical protein
MKRYSRKYSVNGRIYLNSDLKYTENMQNMEENMKQNAEYSYHGIFSSLALAYVTISSSSLHTTEYASLNPAAAIGKT